MLCQPMWVGAPKFICLLTISVPLKTWGPSLDYSQSDFRLFSASLCVCGTFRTSSSPASLAIIVFHFVVVVGKNPRAK